MKDKLERIWNCCHVDENYRNTFQHVNEGKTDISDNVALILCLSHLKSFIQRISTKMRLIDTTPKYLDGKFITKSGKKFWIKSKLGIVCGMKNCNTK